VSWGTRIFAGLVFILAVGAVAAFVILVLPSQIATLSQSEARELRTARQATADVSTSVNTLWPEIATKGSLSLPDDRLRQDLVLSQATEKAAGDALGHAQAAQTYLAQIDGIPFQLHPAPISASDRPALLHLETSLGAAARLAHGATLQITIAQHVRQDALALTGSLGQSLAGHDWTAASRTAANIQDDLKSEETAAANPETLLDPLWTAWMDGMISYASTAQQFSLASAAGQTQSAQQLAGEMVAASDRTSAAMAAAQAGAPAWQQKTVQPLEDILRKELAAGS
jgi:hypothetical protein